MHPKLLQIGQRRFPVPALKAPVEPAAADARKGGGVVNGDQIGVVVGEKFRRLFHAVGAVFRLRLSLDQLSKQKIGIAQHLRPAPDGLAARVVDCGDVLLDAAAEADGAHRRLRADAALRGKRRRVRAGEAQPVIFPWVRLVSAVAHERVRPDQKNLTGTDGVGASVQRVGPLAGDDIVKKIMVAHTRAPVIARRALLKAHVLDDQRKPGGAGFVGVLEILRHLTAPFTADIRIIAQCATKIHINIGYSIECAT